MRNFILGVVVTLAVLILGGLGAALLGFIPTNANATPPRIEAHLAMSAVDASADKRASKANSPILPSAENLIDGMKLYTMNCAGCHGGLDKKPSLQASHSIPRRRNWSCIRQTTLTGTTTTSSTMASAIPACLPGTKFSVIRTSGR